MKKLKYKFWFAVHNLIAHPLLCTGKEWADRFHDWTAEKMEVDDNVHSVYEHE